MIDLARGRTLMDAVPFAWTDTESEVGDAINFAKQNGSGDLLQVETDYIKEVYDGMIITSRGVVCEIH